MTNQAFAELALGGSAELDDEHIHNMMAVLDGESVPTEAMDAAALDFLYPPTKEPEPAQLPQEPLMELDPEETAELLAAPRTHQLPPLLQPRSAHVNLDDWLKKKG